MGSGPADELPPDLTGLLDRRQAARERRDFATADAIRDQLRQAGWLVRDTPHGPEVDPAPPYETFGPAELLPDGVGGGEVPPLPGRLPPVEEPGEVGR